ncbi:MAG: dihydrodipicolinate synthase family protein [Spirochaetaceae bacterium]|nr:MAG: dihydrodipicolinate synthase family protein [Spirochaetaceae bacterium]
MKDKQLHGVIPALITPMDRRSGVDYGALEKQASYLSAAGVQGFFIGGTTAEGAYLNTEELRLSFQVVQKASQGKQFLCLACLRSSTESVCKEVEALSDLNPDFLVIITPYYLKYRQSDILAHYRQVIEVSSTPVIVYNIPSTTHNLITLDTVLELARDPRVAGTKDSSGDFIPFSRGVLAHSGEGFSWIQGEDYLHGPSLMIGAQGIVTGLGNVFIEDYVEMYRASRQHDWETVRTMQQRINRLYGVIRSCEGRVIPAIKAAVSALGRCEPWLRARSMTPGKEELAAVKQVLASLEERATT